MIRIIPERRVRKAWTPCRPHQAGRWSVFSNDTRLVSFPSRAEAERAAAAVQRPRPRSRDACLGQRWSDVVQHVAGRNAQ